MFKHRILTILLIVIYALGGTLYAKEYDKTSYYVAYDTEDTKQFVLVLPSVQKAYTHEAGHIAATDLKPVDEQFISFPKYNNGNLCFSALKSDASGDNGASIMAEKCYEVKFFYTQKEVVSGGVAFMLFYAPADKVYEGLAGDSESFEVVREGTKVFNENSMTGDDYSNFVFNKDTGTVEGVVRDTGDATAPVITLNGEEYVSLVIGDTYSDAGATASDNVDGEVTVTSSGTVDTDTVGTYTITYNASDSTGNSAVTVTRTIYVTPKLTPIEETKALFTELRTQAMSVVDYNNSETPGFLDTEALSMEEALNGVTLNVQYMGDVLNVLTENIGNAYEEDLSHITGSLMDGNRGFALEKTAPGAWSYNIVEGTTTWSGTIAFPEILMSDEVVAQLYTFTTLTITVDGTVPLDYIAVTEEGITDSQSFKGTFSVTKTVSGADISLDGEVASNGTSLTLTNATAALAYEESQENEDGETEPVLNYFKLNNLTVQGVVGGYTIDGSLVVNSYAQNAGLAKKGGIYEETKSEFGVYFYCNNGSQINISDVTFNYNGTTYQPSGYSFNDFWFNDINEEIQYNDILSNLNYNGSCVGGDTVNVNVSHSWTDTDGKIANSGWLPDDITFTGSLSRENASIEGTLNAKWLNAATMDIESDTEMPLVEVKVEGKLQMPDRPEMLTTFTFVNSEKDITIGASYAYDYTRITIAALFDTNMANGDIEITTPSGLRADIKITDGNLVTDGTSTVSKDGVNIGTLEERFNVPVIKYTDGSFESLP